jgi:hypothetical protein
MKNMEAIYAIGLDAINDSCEVYYSKNRDCLYNVFIGEVSNIEFESIYKINRSVETNGRQTCARVDFADLINVKPADTLKLVDYLKKTFVELEPKALIININTEQANLLKDDVWNGFVHESRSKLFEQRAKADIYAQRLVGIDLSINGSMKLVDIVD